MNVVGVSAVDGFPKILLFVAGPSRVEANRGNPEVLADSCGLAAQLANQVAHVSTFTPRPIPSSVIGTMRCSKMSRIIPIDWV